MFARLFGLLVNLHLSVGAGVHFSNLLCDAEFETELFGTLLENTVASIGNPVAKFAGPTRHQPNLDMDEIARRTVPHDVRIRNLGVRFDRGGIDRFLLAQSPGEVFQERDDGEPFGHSGGKGEDNERHGGQGTRASRVS